MAKPDQVDKYQVKVQQDHIERVSRTRPIQAVAELVWNALDADATTVEVELVYDDLAGMNSVIVRDNGHGIPHERARDLFTHLGGSWKAHGNRSKTEGRMLHGKAGQGRFKAFTLGRVVDWFVTYKGDNGFRTYDINIIKDNIREVRISKEQPIEDRGSGVTVSVSELFKNWQSLEQDGAMQELTETFALYLTDYPNAAVFIQGQKVDPSAAIHARTSVDLNAIQYEEESYEAKLDIIEWKAATEKVLYLCDEQGFPLSRTHTKFHTGDFRFSAYLKSPFISKLNEDGVLELADMHQTLQNTCDEAHQAIKEHFRDRAAEQARSVIEQWKVDKVYPYEGEAASHVEEAERKVFDIVAVNVSMQLPDFSESERKSKAFQLRMLRHAIEQSPDDLQLILSEVLDLPKRKQKELADLLQETTLSAIISASKLVSDRLKFIYGLETILFDADINKHLKERSELHKLLEINTWIFGEEFNLTVSDQSLTEVLRQHAKKRKLTVKIDEPVKRLSGKTGIIDLMLSQAVKRNRADELEHLVVELKAPKVKIDIKEITQIKEYAFAVANDPRFHGADTRWTFWIISDELADFARQEANQANRPEGIIHQSDDGPRITIWAMEWAQVIRENKARHEFFKIALEHNVDKGSSLRHLRESYETLLEGVITDEVIAEAEKS